MTNAELITALRICANQTCCDNCPRYDIDHTQDAQRCCIQLINDAADALEAADKRIEELEKSYSWKAYAALEERIEGYKARIAELESQAAFFDAEKLNYQENIEYRDERIKELEAQMPKDGEWIWDSDTGTYHCSECNTTSPREDQDGEYIDCPNYCPNCGAKMRGEHDD